MNENICDSMNHWIYAEKLSSGAILHYKSQPVGMV